MSLTYIGMTAMDDLTMEWDGGHVETLRIMTEGSILAALAQVNNAVDWSVDALDVGWSVTCGLTMGRGYEQRSTKVALRDEGDVHQVGVHLLEQVFAGWKMAHRNWGSNAGAAGGGNRGGGVSVGGGATGETEEGAGDGENHREGEE